jgi:hypothetical protein
MKMPCRITEEHIYNPWEGLDDDNKSNIRGLGDVTVDDLMARDTYVWVSKNKDYGYLLELENDNSTEPFLREVGIHPCAMESLANFCRRYLNFYDKIEAA